jgi:hypothetical protein
MKGFFKSSIVYYVGWPILIVITGCSSIPREYQVDDLSDPDPAVRILAARWAGENRVKEAMPHLVQCLDDEDESVRFFAISALQRIHGDNLGYDYKARSRQRKNAIDRWRAAVGLPCEGEP